jgi:hypothetical protein
MKRRTKVRMRVVGVHRCQRIASLGSCTVRVVALCTTSRLKKILHGCMTAHNPYFANILVYKHVTSDARVVKIVRRRKHSLFLVEDTFNETDLLRFGGMMFVFLDGSWTPFSTFCRSSQCSAVGRQLLVRCWSYHLKHNPYRGSNHEDSFGLPCCRLGNPIQCLPVHVEMEGSDA